MEKNKTSTYLFEYFFAANTVIYFSLWILDWVSCKCFSEVQEKVSVESLYHIYRFVGIFNKTSYVTVTEQTLAICKPTSQYEKIPKQKVNFCYLL